MPKRYADRSEAGRILARHLGAYAGRDDVIVLGLPRGGVPVAAEVAQALGAPLDVFVVRKLGAPGYEECAMGAVASGGLRVIHDEAVALLRIPPAVLERATVREMARIAQREALYRHGRPTLELAGKTLIVVDDGLATGSTMRAAVQSLRLVGPAAIVVAVPVGAPDTCAALSTEADAVICPSQPTRFGSVSAWYVDFDQTSDDEVTALLDAQGAPTTGST